MWDHFKSAVVDGDVWCIGDVLCHYVSLFYADSESKFFAYEKLVIIACRASTECAARVASSTNSIWIF